VPLDGVVQPATAFTHKAIAVAKVEDYAHW
jgi:hypothetical protein